eukprot:CAMPEP_0115256946 /NCGR_PEP_ID=MMETSP0270-20121206/46513_1 /TAXON_ID=71861 /ORGANISM="Scrippsiella trochoidea, Strain CCMP3099" /LENGTH=280 /DNA_ID=CAMNT_0002672625 /DNA_START=86 /DNA_END=928 /DNA_ORIENTATION=-
MAAAGSLGIAASAALRGVAFSVPSSWRVADRRGSLGTEARGDDMVSPSLVQQSPQRASGDIAACAAVVAMAAALAHGARNVQRRSAAAASSSTRSARTVRACALAHGEDLSVPDDAFIVLGLAHCFEQVEGKLKDVWVLEPISASTVEVVNNGAATSYEAFVGTSVGQVLAKDLSAFPSDLLCGHEAQWCSDLTFRTGCAARTWMRDHARDVVKKLVPEGEVCSDFNTSTEHKRILNFVNEVKDSDNIKQDMSIDVYGREGDEDTPKDEVDSQIAELYNV